MKKALCIFVTFVFIFISCVPAVAVEEEYRPSVEEILTGFHEALTTESTSTYSLNNNDTDALVEDTVEQLRNAGYEAYNVNDSTYEDVAQILDTDLEQLGVVPGSSYIIVVSAEHPSTASSRQTRVGSLPMPDHMGDGSGGDEDSSRFQYTYNGETYTMRYITVTSTDNPNFEMNDNYDLTENIEGAKLVEALEATAILALDVLGDEIPIGTILSLMGLDFEVDFYTMSSPEITFFGTTQWTRTYIEVKNPAGDWVKRYSTAFVSAKCYCAGYIDHKRFSGEEVTKIIYAPDYYNQDKQKEIAAYCASEYVVDHDFTGDVTFYCGEMEMFTLYEPLG